MSQRYLQIDPEDNLIVAIQDLKKGETVEVNGQSLVLKQDIQAKHKFSLYNVEKGDGLYMYGVLVGEATHAFAQGMAITVDNVVHTTEQWGVKKDRSDWVGPDVAKWKSRTFNGYHRADGKVGTANYWIVVPLTFCENRNIEVLQETLVETLGYKTRKDFAVDVHVLSDLYRSGATDNELLDADISISKKEIHENRVFPNVDGIKFLKHEGGCGGTREDAEVLCRLIAGYLTNSNVAGATILSLGCQNAEISLLHQAIKACDPSFSKPLYVMEQQQSRSERSFIEEIVKSTFLGLKEANKSKREPASIEHLVMGLECGGSDGFSGISANPALGYASDLLAAIGGSPILAEFPELNGVEQEIINRCLNEEDADRFALIMKAYGERAIAIGSGFKNNPSPGNIKDGLITDAMKSAGAAKKGGTSPIVQVLDYTEQVTKKGLNLLCTPGNDVESTTGLAGSGANVIVFTTGLGTPTGNPIVPVVKLSSNNDLSKKMRDVIDLNAGTIISGEDTIQSKGEEILEFVIEVASGNYTTKAMELGQDDFIPWKRGISL